MQKCIIKKSLQHYEIDRNGFIRPVVLMNWLQTLADSHAEDLGFGYSFCIKNNFIWVVTNYIIEINELPREGEEFELVTWPSGHGGVRATRDFEIRGTDGRIMIAATSQWVLINIYTRLPIRLTDNIKSFDCTSERAVNKPFEKLSEFIPNISCTFDCKYDDVDINGHINNAVYVLWAMESLPVEFRHNHKLSGLKINFVREVLPDLKNIKSNCLIDGNFSRHEIKSDNIINAEILCCWEAN